MPADIPQALPHMTSRWQGGVSTFGPKGRMISTGITLIIPAWFVFLSLYAGLIAIAIGIPVVVTWCGWVAPWILRDTWARDAFYVPVPPIPPSQQMMTWDGHRIPTLEEYVASQPGADARS
jgi:hypothetical protein